jgi:23S rRNA (adenine-N6)-dimethyltransferase
VSAAQRRWAWHQLDTRWAQQLVADATLRPGAIVVDVGAGDGALTAPLIAAGARVIAVEAHPDRVRHLRERFGHAAIVVRADARDLRLPRRPFQIVANPPFNVTAALLRRVLQPGNRLVAARLVLQEQAARKWAGPTAPGRARWGRAFEMSLGPRIPRAAFRPPPNVNARVLVIRRRS